MKLSEIYTNINTELGKDGNGGYLTMDRFNTELPSVLYSLIRKHVKNYPLQAEDQLMTLEILRYLHVKKSSATVTSGNINLTSAILGYDMLYWGAMYGVLNGTFRKVNLCQPVEWNDKLSNFMSMDIDENPIALMYPIENLSGGIYYYSDVYAARILPSNITTVDFLYIRKPRTPFLDYYINTNYEIKYLNEGASRTLTSGEQYRDGSTSGTKTGITQELEIPEDFHPEFQSMMIGKVSVMLGDQLTTQVAMTKEQTA
jgi:hypothetical protein